jgi:hypothetical protein
MGRCTAEYCQTKEPHQKASTAQMFLLLAANINNLFAPVSAAVGANMMCDMIFAAVFALCQLLQCHRILGTALIATAPGMALLW